MNIDMQKSDYKTWWYSISSSQKLDFVEQLYGYNVTIHDLLSHISDSEIEELHYCRDMFTK